jgi:predicted transglutaminase-like cysteine proteinase
VAVRGIKGFVAVLTLVPGVYGCATAGPNPDATGLQFLVHDRTPSKGGAVAPPPGFLDFCERFADQCAAPEDAPQPASLTDETLGLVQLVNTAMNRAIRPEEDKAHYGREEFWTIPLDGYGDCDDYVLVKRKALINLGMPASALRIALVFAPGFVRHAVLTVSTDKGNYVLDNLTDDILSWDRTAYTWIKWQDPKSKTGWASLE